MQLAPTKGAATSRQARDVPSVEARDLIHTLGALADAVDEIAGAVEQHEHDRLVNATRRTSTLLEQLDQRSGAVEAEGVQLRDTVFPLVERIRTGLRRNAYLIERAWAIDAETMRLLAGIGRVAADGASVPYGESSTSTGYLRQA